MAYAWLYSQVSLLAGLEAPFEAPGIEDKLATSKANTYYPKADLLKFSKQLGFLSSWYFLS